MKKNIKFYSILLLLLVAIGLIVYGVFYALKNYNRGEIMTVNTVDLKKTISSDQLDSVTQPNPNLPLTLKELPKANNTINDIDFKTLKRLFQTDNKSILLLVKNDCDFCNQLNPIAEEVLKELNTKAYRLNLSKLSDSEVKELYNYIDYSGTPTTYVIDKGIAKHTLTGIVDKESLTAFIDYFYSRSN